MHTCFNLSFSSVFSLFTFSNSFWSSYNYIFDNAQKKTKQTRFFLSQCMLLFFCHTCADTHTLTDTKNQKKKQKGQNLQFDDLLPHVFIFLFLLCSYDLCVFVCVLVATLNDTKITK